MDYEFCFQDPTSAETVYLYEAIISAAQCASEWIAIFAFASQNGVRNLIEDPIIEQFLDRGGIFRLIVGIDAVTNRQTLEYLAHVETEHPNFSVRVFWNESAGLFHPKFSHFRRDDGREELIVGSGNLTPGGLRENYEAYTVLRSSRVRERINASALYRFLTDREADLRAIDEEILQRAARNIIVAGRRGRRRTREIEPEAVEATAEAILEPREEAAAAAIGRVLVAQVPKAGGRWHQVHFNRDVINQFFQIQPGTTQRVYLVERRQDGSSGEQEVRPCILSQTNLNYKIELGARREAAYPDHGVPIAVFRELHARSFEYMLIFPGEPGYDILLQLTDELLSIGRGLPRVITDTHTLGDTWPESPLLS